MKIQIYKLSRDRKKIDIKDLDLNKFERIGTTGYGLGFKYKKGKSIFVSTEEQFKLILEMQKQNDNAVEKRYFTYARINENESSSKQNTLRDSKGKPIRVYEEPIDYFLQFKHLKYISENDFDIAYEYSKKENIFMECYCGEWESN